MRLWSFRSCRSSNSSNKLVPRAVMVSIRNHNIADDHYNVALEPLNCRKNTWEYICIFESLNTSVNISMKHSRDPHLNVTRHATLIQSSLQIVPSQNLVQLLWLHHISHSYFWAWEWQRCSKVKMTKINIAAVHESDPRTPYAKYGKGTASLLSQTLPFTPKRYARVHRHLATHNTGAATSLSMTLDLSSPNSKTWQK